MGDFSYLSIFIESFMWLTTPFASASCSPHPTHPPTLHLFYVGYLRHSCFSSWGPHAALSQHKTNESSPPSWLHLISSSRKWHIRKRLHRPFVSTNNIAKVILEAMKFSWWHFISEKWFFLMVTESIWNNPGIHVFLCLWKISLQDILFKLCSCW